jgi:hypothetical protein
LSPSASQAVVLPGVIVDFLDRATVALAATRDADLVPHIHRVAGWRVAPDRRGLTCLVDEEHTFHLRSDLEDNGRFAVTIEEIGPHETYQFKGRVVALSPPDEEDRLAASRMRERFTKIIALLYGINEETCVAHLRDPTVAVRFQVEEIFLQTPGPGAGRRIVPPEE